MSTKEFYIDIDRSAANWSYYLRLRNKEYQSGPGPQIATFNPYACIQRPGLMEKIVRLLNDNLEHADGE